MGPPQRIVIVGLGIAVPFICWIVLVVVHVAALAEEMTEPRRRFCDIGAKYVSRKLLVQASCWVDHHVGGIQIPVF
jgi:hypothetical protein